MKQDYLASQLVRIVAPTTLAALLAFGPFCTHAMAACGLDTLGTARILTLKHEFAAYGAAQHAALPLGPHEVVLTFDDGPQPEPAPLVLKALADQCAKATIMAVGGNLAQFPDLARQELAQGHSIGLHSYAHPHPKAISPV